MIKFLKTKYSFVLLCTAIIFSQISCIQPFPPDLLVQLKDTIKPSVEILSPEDRGTYLEQVVVSGRITGEENIARQITSISYSVTDSVQTLINSREIQLEEDASFLFDFSSVLFSNAIVVTVTAVDWNNNTESASVILNPAESELPSFTVESGNQQAEVRWNAVEGAAEYTLRYSNDGAVPTENYGISRTYAPDEQGSYSETIDGLINGNAHIFQLLVELDDGTLLSSRLETALPLSPQTLLPTVASDYRKLSVEWLDIPGADNYEIWRSVGDETNYTIFKQTAGNSFIDNAVLEDTNYFYKIRPLFEDSILSGSAWGTSDVFPSEVSAVNLLEGYSLSADVVKIRVTDTIGVAYLENGYLQIGDVSISDHLTFPSSLYAPDIADYEIWNTTLIAVDNSGTVYTWDLSSLDSPLLLDSFTLSGSITPKMLKVNEWYAFVLDTAGRVHFVNIQDPADLSFRESFLPREPGSEQGLAISMAVPKTTSNPNYTYYYIGTDLDSDDEMHVMRCWVYSPSSGLPAGQFLTTGFTETFYKPTRLEVSDNGVYVYVAGEATAIIELPYFRIFIRNGSTLNAVGTLTGNITGIPGRISEQDETLFVQDGWGYKAVDISGLTTPVVDEDRSWDTPGSSIDLDINNRQVFVAADRMGLQTVALTTINTPQVTGTIPGFSAYSIAKKGNFLYVAGGSSAPYELRSYDVSDPSEPLLLDTVTIGMQAKNITVAGSCLFLTSGGNFMEVADISNPLDLSLAASLELDYYTSKTLVKGEILYTLTSAGLTIYNIADPEDPQFIGFNDDQFTMNDLALREERLYITDSEYFRPSDLFVYNVEDPRTPLVSTSKSLGNMIKNLKIQKDILYVDNDSPSGGNLLSVVDIDPASLTYLDSLGSVLIDTVGIDLEVQGGYAFSMVEGDEFASEFDGLLIINISGTAAMDGTAAAVLKTFSLGSYSTNQLLVEGRYGYVADTVNGVKIISFVY